MSIMQKISDLRAILPSSDGQFVPCPSIMTEEELTLIRFLQIPEISKARSHENVIEHLNSYQNLCFHCPFVGVEGEEFTGEPLKLGAPQ